MSTNLDDLNIAPWAQISSEKVIGAGWPLVSLAGRNVWVDSALGSNSLGSGTRSAPFATVAYALTKAVANDVILCKPGHAETIAAAGGLTLGGVFVRSWASSGGTYTNDLAATNASPSVVSSASYTFTQADVGKRIVWTDGTNMRLCSSLVVSVSSGSATMDANVTTGGGAGSAGTANMYTEIPRVRIQGLGHGDARATFTYATAVAASCDVPGANCAIDNCVFDVGSAAVEFTALINAYSVGLRFTNNKVIFRSSAGGGVLSLLLNASAGKSLIADNMFVGSANANTLTCIKLGAAAANDVRIERNFIQGNFTTSLGGIDASTGACLDLNIVGNFINNRTASSTKAIVCHASGTGFIANNRMQILSGTAPITGAAMSWVGGNYYSATIATAGTLI